jgi:hypothetical protein
MRDSGGRRERESSVLSSLANFSMNEFALRRRLRNHQECRLMLDHAIATGCGGVFLRLTAEQYAKLIA